MKRRHSALNPKSQTHTILMNSTIPMESRVDYGPGVRQRTGDVLRQLNTGDKVLLLYQGTLPSQWLGEVQEALAKENFEVIVHTLPEGEDAKSLEQLAKCWELMQKHSFTRNDNIVALGGGSVTDVAGFCAATYL